MLSAEAVFRSNIRIAREQAGLFQFLSASIVSPLPIDDILRMQVVLSVSAFDKLIHDIIRAGMVASFVGRRPVTSKFDSHAITLGLHRNLRGATLPPAEVLFEQEIIRKLKIMSFQDPDKVADGLGLIWSEEHKWKKIAGRIGLAENIARTTLKLIATRRNAIVHEADMDPLTNTRTAITRSEADAVTDFLETCGVAIVRLVA
jgi:hypothetical protein